MEKTEYISSISVTEEVKKIYEESKDKDEFIEKYIKSFSSMLKGQEERELNNINESLLEFRNILSLMIKKYKEVYNEEVDKLDDFWTELQKGKPKFLEEAGKLANEIRNISKEIKPIINEARTIQEQLNTIDVYRLNTLVDAIEKFKGLSSDEKNIIALLLNKK